MAVFSVSLCVSPSVAVAISVSVSISVPVSVSVSVAISRSRARSLPRRALYTHSRSAQRRPQVVYASRQRLQLSLRVRRSLYLPCS